MENTTVCTQFRIEQGRFGAGWAARPSASGLLLRIHRWRELHRQRRELERLSDEMLKDIGISRVDALREAQRSFWDDPKL